MAEQAAPVTPADPTLTEAVVPGNSGTGALVPPPSPAPIQMTRAELDKMIDDARRAAISSAKDTDEVKQLRADAKRLKELEDAQKSETEKLTERATKAEQLAAERAARYQSALKASAFRLAAREKGVPADRLDDAYRLADLAAVEIDEASDSVKGMDAAVDALIAARPWLTVTETKPGGQSAAIPGTPKPNADTRALTEAEEQRRQALARQQVRSRF